MINLAQSSTGVMAYCFLVFPIGARKMVKGQPNSQVIEDLDSFSDFLRRHNFFSEYIGARDTWIISVYETQLTATVQALSL